MVSKDVSCQFKSKFDDTIPADVSYIKLGAQPFKKFIVNQIIFQVELKTVNYMVADTTYCLCRRAILLERLLESLIEI